MISGLLLAERFFFECVQPIITKHLPQLDEAYAAGLIGYGSDVIGNDDDLSRDHEWGPRLLLFLPEAVHERHATELDRVLSQTLPVTFLGFPTRFESSESHGNTLTMSSSGYGRHHVGITTVSRFMELTLGCRNVPQHDREWLFLPEQRLLEFSSGSIFADPVGEIMSYRRQFNYFPEDVWKYKLAYILESLGWELGLIALCGRRNDMLSMRLNIAVTVERIMKLSFLLYQRYCPDYKKWLHREFTKLPLDDNGQLVELLHRALLVDDQVAVMNDLHTALDILYQKLLTLNFISLPAQSPYTEVRGSAVMDTQAIAKVVLAAVAGPLRELTIADAPYGAVDQWVTHEDILLSPAHMWSMRNVFEPSLTERAGVTEDII